MKTKKMDKKGMNKMMKSEEMTMPYEDMVIRKPKFKTTVSVKKVIKKK